MSVIATFAVALNQVLYYRITAQPRDRPHPKTCSHTHVNSLDIVAEQLLDLFTLDRRVDNDFLTGDPVLILRQLISCAIA